MYLQPLTCKNCGGSINRSSYVCEYCGTAYEDRNGIPHIIEVQQKPCRVLTTRTSIPEELLRSTARDSVIDFTMSDIRSQLAKALEDYLKIEMSFDPRTMRQIITARVRVIDPDYRF